VPARHVRQGCPAVTHTLRSNRALLASSEWPQVIVCVYRGADGRTRTGDLLITNQLLYQLSYVGALGGDRITLLA
jgi:hypothetical protein